jgi:hypothetical protein
MPDARDAVGGRLLMLESAAPGVIGGGADWLRLLSEESGSSSGRCPQYGLGVSGLFPKAFAYLTDVIAASQRDAVGAIDESRCPDVPYFSARPRSEAGDLARVPFVDESPGGARSSGWPRYRRERDAGWAQ